ncbi:MAG: hypothetical protein M3343_10040 [Actinomycetota bacterium]|nr:hypothetical protein [Actinomycetota bacterium]
MRAAMLWRLVVVLVGASLAAITVALGLSRPDGIPGIADYQDISDPIYSLSQFLFIVVGLGVLHRRPRQLVARLFVIIGSVGIVGTFSYEYAARALLVHPGSLDGGAIASWLYFLVLTPIVSWTAIAILRFPSGKLPSRGWRIVEAAALGGIALTVAGAIVLWPHSGPVLLDELPPLDGAADLLWDAPYLLMLPAIFGALVSLLFRYRRAPDVERLQLKWFVFAIVVSLVGVAVGPLASVEGSGNEILASVGVLLIPIATGLAILRYRLYDIDRIISRTLAYGLLTAILAGGYLLTILALQSVLPVNDRSPVIVAVSTLAVVAAFGPLRSRIQHAVDRRFNRSSYDAQQTIESFGSRLRDEVDIDSLATDLTSVVERAMQPAHVSVWISSGDAPLGRRR